MPESALTEKLRPWINLASVVVALAVNIVASALPLNGQNTGEISNLFKVYFVPAGYVFAIWGVIYLGWLAFVIYQLLPAQRSNPRLQRLEYWFAISNIFNAAWLICWHYNQFPLSVVVMLALLTFLIISYLKLNVNRTDASNVERWCVDIPFSMYLGWISVATIANISDALSLTSWDLFGLTPQLWTVIMLVIASALGAAMAQSRRDVVYLLVLAWSFIGIAVKHLGPTAMPHPILVIGAATLAALAMLILAAYSMWLSRRQPIKEA